MRLTTSVSNSFTPSRSIWAMDGRSSTTISSTSFSTSSRTSRKKPVANRARSACCAFSSFMVSPTLTGR
jgi:hypothetical protein